MVESNIVASGAYTILGTGVIKKIHLVFVKLIKTYDHENTLLEHLPGHWESPHREGTEV